MFDTDEIETMDGTRAWSVTQALFSGVPERGTVRHDLVAGWYDTDVEPNLGAFALVQSGTEFEDLVGDFLGVTYGERTIYVYCLGSTALDNEMALSRTAFFHLEDLAVGTIDVLMQVVIP